MMKSLRGWEFDEMEEKLSATKKPNSYVYVALLHDVGRFEQYDLYQTFDDHKSEDHARLSLKVINKENVLKGLDL